MGAGACSSRSPRSRWRASRVDGQVFAPKNAAFVGIKATWPIAVQLAEETIASAEEAYRVTDALVRAGSGTISDLLDAQSALTQAKHHLTRAHYERAIARIQLARSEGMP